MATFPAKEACNPSENSRDVRVRNRGCIDPLVFDMALWEILKRGKPSDISGESILAAKRAAGDVVLKGKCDPVGGGMALAVPSPGAISKCPGINTYLHIDTSLSYSDLSPPSLT